MRYVFDFFLDSPAAIDHGRCGVVIINPLLWIRIPRAQRRFILEHEEAHCEDEIYSEIQADAVAFQEFVEDGGDPEDALAAVRDNLDHSDPEVRQRIQLLEEKAMWNFIPSDAEQTGAPAPPAPNTDPQQGWDADDYNNLFDNILDSVPAVISSLRGQPYYQNPTGGYSSGRPRQDNTWVWLVLGVIFLMLIFFFIKRAK